MDDTKTKNISHQGQVNYKTDDKEPKTIIMNTFEKDPLKREKGKMYWNLTGSSIEINKYESNTFALTNRPKLTEKNQTTNTEDGYVSNQEEFSVMKPTMNQTVDDKKRGKSVGFEGNSYKNPEHEVHDTSQKSTSTITSTETPMNRMAWSLTLV